MRCRSGEIICLMEAWKNADTLGWFWGSRCSTAFERILNKRALRKRLYCLTSFRTNGRVAVKVKGVPGVGPCPSCEPSLRIPGNSSTAQRGTPRSCGGVKEGASGGRDKSGEINRAASLAIQRAYSIPFTLGIVDRRQRTARCAEPAVRVTYEIISSRYAPLPIHPGVHRRTLSRGTIVNISKF